MTRAPTRALSETVRRTCERLWRPTTVASLKNNADDASSTCLMLLMSALCGAMVQLDDAFKVCHTDFGAKLLFRSRGNITCTRFFNLVARKNHFELLAAIEKARDGVPQILDATLTLDDDAVGRLLIVPKILGGQEVLVGIRTQDAGGLAFPTYPSTPPSTRRMSTPGVEHYHSHSGSSCWNSGEAGEPVAMEALDEDAPCFVSTEHGSEFSWVMGDHRFGESFQLPHPLPKRKRSIDSHASHCSERSKCSMASFKSFRSRMPALSFSASRRNSLAYTTSPESSPRGSSTPVMPRFPFRAPAVSTTGCQTDAYEPEATEVGVQTEATHLPDTQHGARPPLTPGSAVRRQRLGTKSSAGSSTRGVSTSCGSSSHASPAMCHLLATPGDTTAFAMKELMPHINAAGATGACCMWHATVQTLSETVTKLHDHPCRAHARWMPYSGWQCHDCHGLNDVDTVECQICYADRLLGADDGTASTISEYE